MSQTVGPQRNRANKVNQHVEFNILEQIPNIWFKNRETSSIWLSGYRMMRVTNESIPEGMRYFDLKKARIFLFYGTVDYIDSSSATPQISPNGDVIFDTSAINKQTPIGAYLIIVLPFDVDSKEGNERVTKDRIADIVGLIASVNQMNMIFTHLFDYVYNLSRKEKSVIGNVIINPFSMPIPELSKERLAFITTIDDAIESKEASLRERIRLSLRWYKSAIYDENVDAFIKYWIAIETLGMSDTKISPLNRALARIYNISQEETRNKFNIGRIFGIRGRIIHDGEQLQIGVTILGYLESIYIDLLYDAIGCQSDYRVGQYIEKYGQILSKELLK